MYFYRSAVNKSCSISYVGYMVTYIFHDLSCLGMAEAWKTGATEP